MSFIAGLFSTSDLPMSRTTDPMLYGTECIGRFFSHLNPSPNLTVEIRPRRPSNVARIGVEMWINMSLCLKNPDKNDDLFAPVRLFLVFKG